MVSWGGFIEMLYDMEYGLQIGCTISYVGLVKCLYYVHGGSRTLPPPDIIPLPITTLVNYTLSTLKNPDAKPYPKLQR